MRTSRDVPACSQAPCSDLLEPFWEEMDSPWKGFWKVLVSRERDEQAGRRNRNFPGLGGEQAPDIVGMVRATARESSGPQNGRRAALIPDYAPPVRAAFCGSRP